MGTSNQINIRAVRTVPYTNSTRTGTSQVVFYLILILILIPYYILYLVQNSTNIVYFQDSRKYSKNLEKHSHRVIVLVSYIGLVLRLNNSFLSSWDTLHLGHLVKCLALLLGCD